MRRLLALLPILVLAGLAALLFGYGLHRKSEVTPSGMVGKPMPEMTLPRLEDQTMTSLGQTVIALSLGPTGARGPVLVNFYASWCTPCIAEAPELMKLKADGVKIIGVSWKDAPSDTQGFLAKYGDPYAAHLVDQDDRLGPEFGVTGAPETYIIGADGVIRDKTAGALTEPNALVALARAAKS